MIVGSLFEVFLKCLRGPCHFIRKHRHRLDISIPAQSMLSSRSHRGMGLNAVECAIVHTKFAPRWLNRLTAVALTNAASLCTLKKPSDLANDPGVAGSC